MKLSDYAACDAFDLAKLIREKSVTWSEVAHAAVEAIGRLNPLLNAVVMENYEQALARGLAPSPTEPLYGVPFLLKDVNVFTEDMPTTFSCAFFRKARPKPDSEIVQRWRRAGLLILGKTNTPEFANDFVTEPTWRGVTLNPWDKSLTVGGSSGGAAAAVSSGMVPLAHATDLGGSIRIPAACCGVFGLKPSVGLNPVGPYYPEIASGLNSDHVITRSVRDSAAALDATAGPGIGARYPVMKSVGSYVASLDQPLPPLRIGFTTAGPDGFEAEARQRDVLHRIVKLLAGMGHKPISYAFPEDVTIGEWFDTLWMVDIANEINTHAKAVGRPPNHEELEALTRYFLKRVSNLNAEEYYTARLRAHRAAVALARSMADIDILLTPALASDPVTVGAIDSRSDNFEYRRWAEAGYGFAPFSAPFNITGQPAASCPVGWSAKEAPLAVQLVGHQGQDHRVLQVARCLEQEFEWQKFRPPIWAGAC